MLHAPFRLQSQFTVDHLSFQSWLLESQGEHRTSAMYVPSFYNFYNENSIKLFVRLNATLYFLSLSYKTFKSEKTATDFQAIWVG